MSGPFQVGVGDFLALANLARSVYNHCRQAPKQYEGVADLAEQLRLLVEDLDADIKARRIEPVQVPRLREHALACSLVLRQIDDLVARHAKLRSRSGSRLATWDRLRWDQQRATELRAQLDSRLHLLNACRLSLVHSSMARVEAAVDQLLRSVDVSLADRQSAWAASSRDLARLGIDDTMVLQHRDAIKQRVWDALQLGDQTREIGPADQQQGGDTAPLPQHPPRPDADWGHGGFSRQSTLQVGSPPRTPLQDDAAAALRGDHHAEHDRDKDDDSPERALCPRSSDGSIMSLPADDDDVQRSARGGVLNGVPVPRLPSKSGSPIGLTSTQRSRTDSALSATRLHPEGVKPTDAEAPSPAVDTSPTWTAPSTISTLPLDSTTASPTPMVDTQSSKPPQPPTPPSRPRKPNAHLPPPAESFLHTLADTHVGKETFFLDEDDRSKKHRSATVPAVKPEPISLEPIYSNGSSKVKHATKPRSAPPRAPVADAKARLQPCDAPSNDCDVADSSILSLTKYLQTFARSDTSPDDLKKDLITVLQLSDVDSVVEINFCKLLLGIKFSLAGRLDDAHFYFHWLFKTGVDYFTFDVPAPAARGKSFWLIVSAAIWSAETSVLLGRPIDAVVAWAWAISMIMGDMASGGSSPSSPADPWHVRSLVRNLDHLLDACPAAHDFFRGCTTPRAALDHSSADMERHATLFLRRRPATLAAVAEARKQTATETHSHWNHHTWDLFLACWVYPRSQEELILRWRGRGPAQRDMIHLDARFLARKAPAADILAFPYRKDPHFCIDGALGLLRIGAQADAPDAPLQMQPSRAADRFRMSFTTRASFAIIAAANPDPDEALLFVWQGIPYALVTWQGRSSYDPQSLVAMRAAFALTPYQVAFSGVGLIVGSTPAFVSRQVNLANGARDNEISKSDIKEIKKKIVAVLEAAEGLARGRRKAGTP